ALGALGFDPGNPMVRAEISRIVERGPQNPGRRRPPSAGTSLGYSEESVEAPDAVVGDATEPEASGTEAVPTPTSATAARETTRDVGNAAGAGRGLWLALGGGAVVVLASGLGLWFRAARR
ncbi:MAG: hypothetical protein ACKPGK_14335, partial [Verrucomicrobiota bacterium]